MISDLVWRAFRLQDRAFRKLLPYPPLLNWDLKKNRLIIHPKKSELIPWFLVTFVGLTCLGILPSGYLLAQEYFFRKMGKKRFGMFKLFCILATGACSFTVILCIILIMVDSAQILTGFNFLKKFDRGISSGKKESKKEMHKQHIFGIFSHIFVLGHASGGMIISLMAVLENLDPYGPIIDMHLSDPFQRTPLGTSGWLLVRYFISLVLITEILRFVCIGCLVLLVTVRIYLHTLRHLKGLPSATFRLKTALFYAQYRTLKLIHACLKEVGDDVILVLMTFGLLAVSCTLAACVRLFGDLEFHIYLMMVVAEVAFLFFIQMTLPVAVEVDELAEEILRKWRVGYYSWNPREKRIIWKSIKALTPIYWSAGTMYKLDRSTRMEFYNGLIDVAVSWLLTVSYDLH